MKNLVKRAISPVCYLLSLEDRTCMLRQRPFPLTCAGDLRDLNAHRAWYLLWFTKEFTLAWGCFLEASAWQWATCQPSQPHVGISLYIHLDLPFFFLSLCTVPLTPCGYGGTGIARFTVIPAVYQKHRKGPWRRNTSLVHLKDCHARVAIALIVTHF